VRYELGFYIPQDGIIKLSVAFTNQNRGAKKLETTQAPVKEETTGI
jgi:hypothetical protein